MASIRKRGDSYEVRIRRTGMATLCATFDKRADAQEWARKKDVEIDSKTCPDTLLARQVLLHDILDEYRTTVTPRHKGADVENLRLLQMQATPLARLSLAELDYLVIEAYIDDRLTTVGPGTVNRELTILVQVLKRARKRRLMAHNPMEDVERPKEPEGRTRRCYGDEWNALKKALKTSRNPVFRALVEFARETGMRRGEMLKIRWWQVDLKRRAIFLKAAQTKMGQAREVPLSRRATALLQKLPHTDDCVFPITPNAIKLAWARVCKRARIVDLHFHDLRHERVSSLVEAGWSTIAAAAVSGHKDMRILRRYAHPRVEVLVASLDELDARC